VLAAPESLTKGTRRAFAPKPSPDGEFLVFQLRTRYEDLFVMRTDGTGLRQITDDFHRDRGARWSSDGKRIAFFSDRNGSYEIWIVNADGSGLKQITHNGVNRVNPVWSPDSLKLAYSDGRASKIVDITKPWQEQSPLVVSNPSENWFAQAWSPDGQWLAGVVPEINYPDAIVLYSLKAKTFEKLADLGSRPIWLSDSRRLLFMREEKIYLIERESRRIREVLAVDSDIQRDRRDRGDNGLLLSGISADDRFIYYSMGRSEADIWLIELP